MLYKCKKLSLKSFSLQAFGILVCVLQGGICNLLSFKMLQLRPAASLPLQLQLQKRLYEEAVSKLVSVNHILLLT